MSNHTALTVKHLHADGSTGWLGAISIQLVWPKGRPCMLLVETAAGEDRREVNTGKAYIINAQGKTIDIIDLSQIAPDAE